VAKYQGFSPRFVAIGLLSLVLTVATASLLDDPNRKLMGLVLLAWFVALWVVAEFFDGVRRP
jgi:hypothetical protein